MRGNDDELFRTLRQAQRPSLNKLHESWLLSIFDVEYQPPATKV